jgi:hypothetical protein
LIIFIFDIFTWLTCNLNFSNTHYCNCFLLQVWIFYIILAQCLMHFTSHCWFLYLYAFNDKKPLCLVLPFMIVYIFYRFFIWLT